MGEVWKPVVGHEGLYEVSDQGRVRSLDRVQTYRAVRHGKEIEVVRRHRGRLLHPGWTGTHLTVALGKGNSRLVHHLVLEAFIGPRPPNMEGCHDDDDGANNRLANLTWGTRSKNMFDAIRNGRRRIGEENPKSRLTDAKVREVRNLLVDQTDYQIAKAFGVSDGTIRQVRYGRTWKHVR